MKLFAFLIGLTLLVLTSPGSFAQSVADCSDFRNAGDNVTCSCPPATARAASVWGSDPYTADSDVCTAAQHAGMIGLEGGIVNLERRPGQSGYDGSSRNGVISKGWGSYDTSFTFVAPPDDTPEACGDFRGAGASLTCTCAPTTARQGSVWGSDTYTADSDLCKAAQHAGLIGSLGGTITAFRQPGQNSYDGTTRNGISTQAYGAYDASFTFAKGAASKSDTDETCGSFLKAGDTLTCACLATDQRAGQVWGTGIYTADSDVCAAAQHAGAIGAEGGTVTALRLQGLAQYRGSSQNGVKTGSWGKYESSFVFDQNR